MGKIQKKTLPKQTLFTAFANAPLSRFSDNFDQVTKAFQKISAGIEKEFGALPTVSNLVPVDHDIPVYQENVYIVDCLHSFIDVMRYFGPDLDESVIKRGQVRSPDYDVSLNFKDLDENEILYLLGSSGISSAELSGDNSVRIKIDRLTEIGFEAAYGFLDRQCLNEDGEWPCLFYNPWIRNLDPAQFFSITSMYSLKCFECHQLAFIEMLKKVISGCPFSEIVGFHDFLQLGVSSAREVVSMDTQDQIDFIFGWRSPYDDMGNYRSGPDAGYPFKHIFNHLIMGLVSYSLESFLAAGLQKNIRQCEICGKFFIGHGSSTVCSKTCDAKRASRNSSKSRKKREMREAARRKEEDRKYSEEIKRKIMEKS